jgi:radical SAM superfamily enzyme YgiQ (UPF0313 family)
MVGFTRIARPEPLALEILASCLEGHDVRIADLRAGEDLGHVLQEFEPQVVGVTGYTIHAPRMLTICQEVKAHNSLITTVAGGHHASLSPEDFDVPDVDYIVIGEGERTFQELVDALETGQDVTQIDGIVHRQHGAQVATPPRELIADLDDTPLPRRELVDRYRSDYFFQFWSSPALIETARGCPYKCTFCSVWKFYQGKCRFKSAERVVAEVERVNEEVVCFTDDNFLQDMRRAEKIESLIRETGLKFRYWLQARSDSIVRRPDLIEKWADIGLSTILIGFEKFREEEMTDLNKRNTVATNEEASRILRANGIDIWGAFIVDPLWERADFDALIEYVRKLHISFPQFTVLTPLPGTQLFQEKLHTLTTHDYELFDFLHSVLPTKLPLPEFYENMARLYSNTAMTVEELKRKLRSGDIPHSSLRRIKGVLSELTCKESYLHTLEP